MAGGVDLAEPVHGDQGVDLGRRDRCVAQQFLDDADVGPAVQHVRGDECRSCAAIRRFRGPGLPARQRRAAPPRHPAGSGARRGRSGTPPGSPRAAATRRPGQAWPGPGTPAGPAPHSCRPGPPAACRLAGQPHHRVGVQLQFVHVESGRLRDPGSGPVQELQQGPVPQQPRIAGHLVPTRAGRREQALHLGQGDRLGQRRGGIGGGTSRAGSVSARPCLAANACSPRTAITARAAELTARASCSASPLSEARNSATSDGVTSPSRALPRPANKDSYRRRSRR